MYKTILKIVIPVLLTGKITAQQVVATAGGEGSVNGINLQWTLGECVIAQANAQNTVILTQGFQQSAYIKSGIPSVTFSGKLKVFPVPATDYITIDCKIDKPDAVTAVLTDINGKSFIKQELTGGVNRVNMQSASSGVYILTVTDRQGNFIKSFKITKQ